MLFPIRVSGPQNDGEGEHLSFQFGRIYSYNWRFVKLLAEVCDCACSGRYQSSLFQVYQIEDPLWLYIEPFLTRYGRYNHHYNTTDIIIVFSSQIIRGCRTRNENVHQAV